MGDLCDFIVSAAVQLFKLGPNFGGHTYEVCNVNLLTWTFAIL